MSRPLKFLLAFAIILSVLIIAYHFYNVSPGCPMEGSARQLRLMELNWLKNRTELPAENDFDRSITLQQILAPGDDSYRFSSSKVVEITAYVYNVKPGGRETCNCEAEDEAQRDTHIEVTLGPDIKRAKERVIVEITPRMRKIMAAKGIDWSTETLSNDLIGKYVKFQGRLLFDFEHERQAENTNPGGKRNWRATSWEIHPVTSIEIIENMVDTTVNPN